MIKTELDEESKKALIAYLRDGKTKLEYRYRFIEDNWTPFSGSDFDLGIFYYRIAQPISIKKLCKNRIASDLLYSE